MPSATKIEKICDGLQYLALLLGCVLVGGVYQGLDASDAFVRWIVGSYLVVYIVSAGLVLPPVSAAFDSKATVVRLTPVRIARLFLGIMPLLAIILIKAVQFQQGV